MHTAETLHSKELLCASEKGLLFSQGEGRRYPTNICQDKDRRSSGPACVGDCTLGMSITQSGRDKANELFTCTQKLWLPHPWQC